VGRRALRSIAPGAALVLAALAALAALATATACRPHRAAPAGTDGGPGGGVAGGVSPLVHAILSATPDKGDRGDRGDRTDPGSLLGRGPGGPQVPCPVSDKQNVDGALDEAARRFDAGEYAVALACAEQAGRAAPRSVEAQHDRADALAALERWDEAKLGYTMALALDPDDPQTLASAADFYINRLGPEHEAHDLATLGLEYARRGSAHVGRRREDRELGARLALYEAEALDDLGRSDEALRRVEASLSLDGKNPEARYQRALVLFHLCRLDKAEKAFGEVLAKTPDDAYAHHHLGLLLERLPGRQAEAEAHFARAHELQPAQFTDPVLLGAAEFRGLVDQAVGSLDAGQRKLLDGVKIEVVDLPEMADLTAVEPPFPPTILGLYRGAPLGEPAGNEPRAIVFYRKNLARAVTGRDELVRQVKITLLHEMGHLTGADEDDLRAKGLE
jgi:predicted Zn-dependent protease with MMP-like domain/Flp pilus assembly protein TadD